MNDKIETIGSPKTKPVKFAAYNPICISLREIDYLGQVMAQSGRFSSIRDKAQAIVQILAGQEMGIPPLVSMTKINVIQGKISISAELMATMIKRSGDYDYKIVEHDSKKCAVQFLHNGQHGYLSVFTIEDAKLAGLVKAGSGWEKYPRALLFSRALSQGAKIECPHLLNGAYTSEEMGAMVDEEGEVISISEPFEAKLQPTKQEPIETAKSEQLKPESIEQKQGDKDVTPAQTNAMRNMLAKITDETLKVEWANKIAEIKTSAKAGEMIVVLGRLNVKSKPIVNEVEMEFKNNSLFNMKYLESIGKKDEFLALLGSYGCEKVEEIEMKDRTLFIAEVNKICKKQ